MKIAGHSHIAQTQFYDRLRQKLKREKICGYKVGATNPEAQRMLGLTSPFYAFLLERMVFKAGKRLQLPPGTNRVIIEPEICYELHPRSGLVGDEPMTVARTWLAIEVVSPPGGTFKGLAFEKLIETNGIHFCLIRGLQPVSADVLISDDMPVRVFVNEKAVASGTPAYVFGHPLNSLKWLLQNISERPVDDTVGMLVTTGSCTPVVTAAVGDRIRAVFGDAGEVSFEITA